MTDEERLGSLDDLYDEAFMYMEREVHELAGLVPLPRMVKRGGLQVFRYLEQTADQRSSHAWLAPSGLRVCSLIAGSCRRSGF